MLTLSVAQFAAVVAYVTLTTAFSNHILVEGFNWKPSKAIWASLMAPIGFPILMAGISLFVMGEGFYYWWVGMCRKGAR